VHRNDNAHISNAPDHNANAHKFGIVSVLSAEEEDCPVTEKLCAAYRQIQDEKIRGITRAIYVTGAVITLLLAALEIALKLTGK
jgi:hypothetical protein